MITPLLRNALEPVVARHRALRRLIVTAAALIGLAAVALIWPWIAGGATLSALMVALLALILWWRAAVWAENWNPDYHQIADRVERQHPELHAVLLTAVEQRPDPATGRLHFLQQRVLAEAVAQARQQQWLDSVPRWKLHAWRFAALAALLAAVLPSVLRPPQSKARPTAVAAAKKTGEDVEISPGNVAVERGSGLVVLATFNREIPSEATLVIQPNNQPAQRIPLVKNLDDPVFGGGLPEIDADLTYRVEYAGQATAEFTVKVFEHPRLDRADATLRFPAYTKLPEKQVPDTRRVSAVEGTKLDVAFALNKPVKSAALVAKDGTKIPLTVEPGQPRVSLRDFTLQASQSYELKLEDDDGRASKVPAQLALEALPNRRPELKIAAPKGDQRVSPLQEVTFGATAWDDFGLLRYGLTVNVAGRGEQAVELGKDTRADEKRELAHLLKLEDVGVKPDELVSWYLWAEDVGPDGQPRRTATDMFFAEVRPFEEIYRRGDDSAAQQQQQQQQSAAGNQAEQMASSQKEIISATWNLKRAEEANVGPQKPSEKYVKDVPVVRDGQAELLSKNAELAAKVEDPKSAALLANVKHEMETALSHLKKAETATEPLPEALGAEQAAYNALLKLAAHEFNVVRQQRQQGQQRGQQQQRNQQQLDELEMKEEKQRYETKREAQPMQNEQQREQLAVLNRLKELAQRQQDINERLKELQTQLQAAQTEKEKEELRRQLKRLREEEQQMLADMDETRQRMEQSPQQSEFAEQRQQLEQTRNDAQQASESMEKGQASQALASGTRAQRDLQQMRDELRKKTSGQFTEEVREMRTDARELAQNQQDIADKLKAEPTKPERRTLDGSSEREQLKKQLEQQRGALAELTEDMKRVSEQAEAAEPLLSKELYDALRKTTQASTGETLEKTEMLAQRGYNQQAQRFEEKARAEIEELKTGVERAAESVLGDEAEALRQARSELDALNEQLTRELARARPDLAANQDGAQQSGEQQSGSTRDARPGEGTPAEQSGASQNSESQEGLPGGSPQRGGQQGERNAQRGNQPGEQQGAGNRDQGNAQTGENGQPGQQNGQGGRQGQGNSQTAQRGNQPGGEQPGEQQPGAGERGESQPQPGDNGQPSNQGNQRTAQRSEQQGRGERAGQVERQGQGQRGQQSEQGQQPGEGQQAQPGQTAPRQPGQGQGEGEQGQNGQNGQGQQPGQGRGQTAGGRGNGGGQQAGNTSNQPNAQRPGARIAELAGQTRQQRGGNEGGGSAGGPIDGEQAGPLTGERFTEWSDRLRNVEEMIDDPKLRTETARVREVAKGVRAEFKRHSVEPNWDLVNAKIRAPLAELRNRLTEELARRESKENLVPIDRDPVPTKFAERVRRYYEDLGRSR